MANADTLTLGRSPVGRLLGGARLQPLVTLLVVLLAVRLVGELAGTVDDPSLPIGATALVLVVAAALAAVGASGYARADATAISWRYYAAHRIEWDDVEQVALVVHSAGVGGVWRTVEVRTARRRHRITPACAAGPDRRRFGRDLLALAASRGIAVRDDWA